MTTRRYRLSTRSRVAALPALALAPLAARAELAAQDATPVSSPAASPVASPAATPVADLRVLPVEMIAPLTGPADSNPINATWEDHGVYGTDLGHTFMAGDDMWMVFGDTFGIDGSDWRNSVAAVITSDDDPTDGVTFDRMIEDDPGHARQLINQEDVEGPEVTNIPTYGVAVDDRLFLHYMQVVFWGPPGQWDLGTSGLAHSDDGGETWIVAPDASWPGDSNFGQVSIVQHEDHLYIHGIPGGRFGGVQVARVAPADFGDLSAWTYWDGGDWVADIAAAETIIPAPVGELSVRWNAYYGQWILMTLNEDRYSITLRTAAELTGPWSEEMIVATGQEFPQLYAPYQFPKWNDGPDIYFTMSMFGPYQVYLLRTTLEDTLS